MSLQSLVSFFQSNVIIITSLLSVGAIIVSVANLIIYASEVRHRRRADLKIESEKCNISMEYYKTEYDEGVKNNFPNPKVTVANRGGVQTTIEQVSLKKDGEKINLGTAGNFRPEDGSYGSHIIRPYPNGLWIGNIITPGETSIYEIDSYRLLRWLHQNKKAPTSEKEEKYRIIFEHVFGRKSSDFIIKVNGKTLKFLKLNCNFDSFKTEIIKR